MTTSARATARGRRREQNGTPREGAGAPEGCLSKRTEDRVPGVEDFCAQGWGRGAAGRACAVLPAQSLRFLRNGFTVGHVSWLVCRVPCRWWRPAVGGSGAPQGWQDLLALWEGPSTGQGGGKAQGWGWASSAVTGDCTQGPEPMGWWEWGAVREKPEGASGREVCPPEDKAQA